MKLWKVCFTNGSHSMYRAKTRRHAAKYARDDIKRLNLKCSIASITEAK